MTEEVWKPVVGWEGFYEVSSLGRFRSLRRGTVFQGTPNASGHRMVSMSRGGQRTQALIHRLIAEAFIGLPPEGKPLVLHWDDNPDNNHVNNLRYGDLSDNQKDAVRNGGHSQTRKTECIRGHELSGDNLRRDRRGNRVCKSCQAMHGRESRKKYGGMGLPEGDERHGSVAGYSLYKCKCGICARAKRESDKAGTERRRKVSLPADDPRHGTYSCYKVWSCRCNRCRRANADYEARRKAVKNGEP